jgi:high-affinity nickel permease
METLSILLAGFLLGMRHATDADHIVAVTTIVSRQKRLSAASLIGMFWGLGHTLTILLIGSAIIYFKLVIPPRIGLLMEFSVGVMIVLLGIHSLKTFAQNGAPVGEEHLMSRPFAIGLIHGLAGSAAVALLMLSLIPSPAMAALYLLVFGLGTMAGMMAVTLAIGIPYIFSLRLQTFHRYLGIATASVSILFGLDMMYELGIENGLFSDNPLWTPE